MNYENVFDSTQQYEQFLGKNSSITIGVRRAATLLSLYDFIETHERYKRAIERWIFVTYAKRCKTSADEKVV